MGCEMGKTSVVMDKPIYIRHAILDLSKTVMYEFHYGHMKPKYDENLQLCYMDTDFLVYNIETNDFYKDIARNVMATFDTSGYSQGHPLHIGVNKKVIGLMKDELGGRVMTNFVALRPKLYAYKTLSGGGDKKCKGVKKCVVKKMLDFDEYKHCLFTKAGQREIVYQKQLMFWNRPHKVYTFRVNKVALNRDDNKQVVQSDGVSTLAHKQKDIKVEDSAISVSQWFQKARNSQAT